MMLVKTLALTLIACMIVGYFLLSPLVAEGVYRYLLFFPQKGPDESYAIKSIDGVTKKDVFIPTPFKIALHGWLFEKPGAKRIALVSHGNAGHLGYRSPLAQALLRAGMSVLLYDYEGYGRTEGSPSNRAICRDGLAAYDYLTSLGYGPDEIVLYGESLGVSVSAYIAKHRPTAGVILQSGFSSLRDVAAERYGLFKYYPESLFPRPSLNTAEWLKDVSSPILVMHGTLDRTISFTHAQTIASKVPVELVTFQGAGHDALYEENRELFFESIAKFMQKLPATGTTVYGAARPARS